jgi:hypothetical protein
LPIVVMDLLHTSTDPSRGAGVTTSLVPDEVCFIRDIGDGTVRLRR